MSIVNFIEYLGAERNYSALTLQAYEEALRSFAEFTFGDREQHWDRVESEDVRAWVAAMIDQGRKPATVHKQLSALRTYYKYLLLRKQVSTNPTATVRGPKREKPLPLFVREKEMDRLLDGITFTDDFRGQRDRLILLLFYSTGMRLAELVGLNVTSVDLIQSTIKVLGKRNKERIIPFGPELKEALRSYLQLRSEQPCAHGNNALFIGQKSLRIARNTVQNIVRSYLSQVTTLQKRSPHVLRHTFATAMLNNGAEIEVVRQLLGHESIATTEIYTHTTFEELKKAYAKAHPRST